jgi:cysteine-rich repeat protein
MVPNNYSCQCAKGFKFDPPSISCVDDCGDGVVRTDECDDGDTVDGDGCSAKCKIENGFMCLTSIEPSKCMPEIKFQLSYEYCKRDITANAATFAFFLTPPSPILSQVDLTKSFTFSFAGKVTSYTYNDQTGKL